MLGKELVAAENGSQEEKLVFEKALLSYPPVYRILTILSDRNAHTKFEMGKQLGFKGELGFTSIPQNIYIYDFVNAKTKVEQAKIRTNIEGDADKYARMIAGWLVKLGWLTTDNKEVTEDYLGETHTANLQAWKITREGEKSIIKSDGRSKHPRIPKIVMFEMLASKISDCDYVRFRRANILKLIKSEKSLIDIQRLLAKKQIVETTDTIQDDITNFINIGLRISIRNGRYKLLDNIIRLDIPTYGKTIPKKVILLL